MAAMSDLLNSYQSMYGAALNQSQDIYNQTLAGYRQRASDLAGQVDVLGQTQLRQAGDYYKQQAEGTKQSAISRGLSNSTVQDSLLGGVNAQRDQALGDINNSIRSQKLGIMQQATGDTLGYQGAYGQQQAQMGMQYANGYANLYQQQQQNALQQQRTPMQYNPNPGYSSQGARPMSLMRWG